MGVGVYARVVGCLGVWATVELFEALSFWELRGIALCASGAHGAGVRCAPKTLPPTPRKPSAFSSGRATGSHWSLRTSLAVLGGGGFEVSGLAFSGTFARLLIEKWLRSCRSVSVTV